MRTSSVHCRRGGWMLVELILVVSMTAVAAGVSAYVVIQLLRMGQVQADSLVRDRALHAWVDQFRLDARSASEAKTNSNSSETGIEFQLPQDRVTYHPIDSGLERHVNGQLAGRWTTRGTWKFRVDAQSHLARAELVSAAELTRSTDLPAGSKSLPPQIQLRVDASIGRLP